MGLGPASAEDGAGLSLASLERDPGPAEFAAEPDQLPVMRALVEKQRLAGGDAVDIDAVGLQLVRERLFDVEDHAVQSRVFGQEAIEDFVDVDRVGDGAVEVGRQPDDPVFNGNGTDLDQPVVIPFSIVSPQLDFQAGQAVGSNPVG